MFSRRTVTLAILTLLPLLVYLGLGAYALWQTGWFAWTFWIIPGCWLFTWLVSIIWKPERVRTAATIKRADHLTPRDDSALAIIRRYQEQVDSIPLMELTNPEFYLNQAIALSRDLAQHYHPKAKDPIDSLTIPEVLAAARLAIDDMERWMLEDVPGSRLVTIRQWKWLQHAPKWIKRAQDTTWLASILINPANVLKYFTSELTMGPITQNLQTEFLAVVYLRFIRQTGFYLIEMNSGRLRGGAEVYRQTFGTAQQQALTPSSTAPRLKPESVTVAIVGQVKAGKSSLVNALLNQQVAKSDVLPETQHVYRYRMEVPESTTILTLLDTPGYADAGATRAQMKEVKQAAREADILLFVMAANSPARSADRDVVDELKKWWGNHPELRPAPIVICLTHIDLLSPVLEWQPPYDWKTPTNRKAQSIHDAVRHVEELFQDVTTTVIPVCSDVQRGRTSQIFEELLPALLAVLSEGQMAAVIKLFHQHLNKERVQTLVRQLKNSGKMLLNAWLDERMSQVQSPARAPTPPVEKKTP